MYKFMYGHIFSILWGIYLWMEWLSHIVTLSIPLCGMARLFLKLQHFIVSHEMYGSYIFSTLSSTQ